MAFEKNQYDVVLFQPPAEVVREHHDTPPYPHIGIAYVGGYLEEHAGITPALVDGKLSRHTVQDTIDVIVALKPKLLGITAKTHEVLTAIRIATEVKKALGELTIVLGGFHGSFLPERSLSEFPVVDYVVVGEGELAFIDVVKAVLGGKSAAGIPGVAYREDGKPVLNGRGTIPDTLDELGAPAYHLFDPQVMKDHCTALAIMSQRGCPFECNFCSRPYGRTVRARSPEAVAQEFATGLQDFGVTEYHFFDETFTVKKSHVTGICDALIERDLARRVKWRSMVWNSFNLFY